MPEETQVQIVPQEEEGGLSTGAQVGIGAFFLGLPFLGMGIELLGWGETGIVLAALGAGSLGLGTKFLIDRNKPDSDDQADESGEEQNSQEPTAHRRKLSMPHFGVMDRLHDADWGALLRSMGEVETSQKETISPASPSPEASASNTTGADAKTTMDFGTTLKPDANKIFSGRKVVIGVSDAGKSNTVAVIAEEIGGPAPHGFGAPLFLLDTEDEYRKLNDKKHLAKPLWMDSSKLTPDNAFAFAQWAVHNLRQVIVNLQSYEDHEAAWVMITLIKGVQAYEETHDVRVPCEFILDEATVWLPQIRSQSTLNRFMIDDPDGQANEAESDSEIEEDEDEDEEEKGKNKSKQISLLSLLERTVFSVIVRRGRKRGMGFTLACQRIAEINKSALQANWMILMRQTQSADFREYKKYGIEAKEAMELQAGEAFVYPPGKTRERHQFRLRRSPHGAKSPGLDELRIHQQRMASQATAAAPVPTTLPAAKRMPEQRAAMQEQSGARQLHAVPPRTGVNRMEELMPNPRLRQIEQTSHEEQEFEEELEFDEPETDPGEDDTQLSEREQQYEQVIKLWWKNIRSIRAMMEPLGLNFNQTRELLEEMDDQGLIAWRKKGEKASV